MRRENGNICEIKFGIFQQYFYFVHKLLLLHLISEIGKFEICKTDFACSVTRGDDDIVFAPNFWN